MNASYKTLILCALFSLSLKAEDKIVGLVAARNESYIIQQCLKALSQITDAIVFLDDNSTDNTVEKVREIAIQCRVERIITKDGQDWHRDETGDRNRLLQTGREIGGKRFILLDADEMPSAPCKDNNFLRKIIYSLQPGEKLVMRLIDLWRSPYYYRIDQSPYANRILDFAFCDDGVCYYDAGFIHSSHSPHHRKGGERWLKDDLHVILHFAFVNWEEVLIKHAWYKCLEHIRLPTKACYTINAEYASATDERGIKLAHINDRWLVGYDFFDPSIFNHISHWRAEQIKGWFAQYGKDHFADLAIWNINWDAY